MTRVPCETLTVFEAPLILCSESMRAVLHTVQRVARSNAAILINGESGSGKELVARAIHQHSLRCSRPWVDVNCGALPEHLVESELFGYEKGAFSGADAPKDGLFELAHTGTLFLDEIGELEAKTQVKLLRVLDGVPYYRLGGTRKVCPDVRIVAATNRDLRQAVETGRFRKDLYYRLSQVQIDIPPLRERPEDVAPLATFFLEQQNPAARFSAEAMAALRNYAWPGNVRELKNVVVNVALLGQGPEIGVEDLPPAFRAPSPASAPVAAGRLDQMEQQMILRVLEEQDGHIIRSARMLGISRRTLARKLRAYGVANVRQGLAALGNE